MKIISSVAGALVCSLLVMTYAMAQDPSSLGDLKREITLLKQIVQNQDKRIAALEREIAELKASENPPVPEKTSKSESLTPGDWRVPSNWERIVDGMSEKQVIAILGRPTSIEDGTIQTLFYRGDVAGSGFVSGNVKMVDDRVFLVNKPVF